MSTDLRSRLNLRGLPNLCELGPRFLSLDGFFRVWLQGHYGDPDNISLPSLKARVWRPEPSQSGIAIETHTAFKEHMSGNRPMLLTKRGKWSGIKLGIDSRSMGFVGPQGERHHANLWQCGHTIFCISRQHGEVEHLAYETFQALNEYMPAIRMAFDFMAMAVVEVGDAQIVEESAGQHWAVAITIGYAVLQNWILTQDAALLRGFDLGINVQ